MFTLATSFRPSNERLGVSVVTFPYAAVRERGDVILLFGNNRECRILAYRWFVRGGYGHLDRLIQIFGVRPLQWASFDGQTVVMAVMAGVGQLVHMLIWGSSD